MRFSHIALAASAVGSVAAADTICDKYTKVLLTDITPKNQLTLLSLLVNTVVIGNYTGPTSSTTKANAGLPGSKVPVDGILAKTTIMGTKVNLLPYFDGTLASSNQNGKAASVNWLDGGGPDPIIASATSPGKSGSNQATLLMHLYSYFGTLLGCSTVGKGDFPAYEGVISMFDVHRFMVLNSAEVTWFVTQVGAAAESFGVSASDAKTVGGLLLDTFGQRCAPKAAIPMGAPKEFPAICTDSDCPKAKGGDCSAYPMLSAPKPASSSGGSGGSSGSGGMGSSGGSSGSGGMGSSGGSSGSGGMGSSGGMGGGSNAATSLTFSGAAAIVAVAGAAAALL